VVRHDLLYVCPVDMAGMGHTLGRTAQRSTGCSMISEAHWSVVDAGWCA